MVNMVPILMAVVGIGQFVYPMIKRSWVLVGVTRDFTSYSPSIDKPGEQCATVHSNVLSGCADMKLHGRTIFATCLTRGATGPHRRWISPQSVLRDEGAAKPRDELVAWDLDTDTVTVLSLDNYPNAEDRAFHGLDVVEVSPSLLSIYVINHLAPNSVIEKFAYEPSSKQASHVSTFSNPSLVPNPHSIWAVPGEDARNAFYITSDHSHRHGLERVLEVVFQLRSSPAVYHSDATGWKTVSPKMPGMGAIAGLKDRKSRNLYIASTTGGTVDVFERVSLTDDMSDAEAESAEGNLTWTQRIPLNFVPSGISVDQPTGKDLYVAGLPKPLEFLTHHGFGPTHFLDRYGAGQLQSWLGYGDAAQLPVAASLVGRINTGQLGSGFFGGGAEKKDQGEGEGGKKPESTAPPVVEDVLVDQYGKYVNGSYSVLFEPSDSAGSGDLFVSGLSSKGILRCKGIAV